jgi:predicted enzyme related to lactoylglutathione lyase
LKHRSLTRKVPHSIFFIQHSSFNIPNSAFVISLIFIQKMFTKLRTVIYNVTDLAKAKKWYAAITGRQPYFDEPFYVGFDIDGYELGLDPDMTGIVPGNSHVSYWSVANVEAAVAECTAAGATLVSPPQNVGGSIITAIVQDPWGNAIGLIEGA